MTNEIEIGEDLKITKIERRQSAGGAWVKGSLNGFAFTALVFPEHAESPDYELGESKISKLWMQRQADHKVVVNFDRGWDVEPTTDTAREIVDFLAAGIAEHVFGH